MRKIIKTISRYLIGEKETLKLEDRIFISASLIWIFAGSLGLIWNISIGLAAQINMFVALIVFFFVLIYFNARLKQKYNKTIFVGVTFLFLSVMWAISNGLDGSIPGLYILVIAVVFSVTKTKDHFIILLVSFINIALLAVAGKMIPGFIMENYPNDELRRQDILFGIFAGVFTCYLLIHFLKRNYDRENAKLIQNELKLKKISNSKDLVFSIIAHDLTAPFNPIMGFTKIMTDKSKKLSNEQLQNYAELTNESAVKAYDLLQSLLDWGKIQQGTVQVNPQKFNLIQIIEESISWFEEQYREKELRVRVQTNELVDICADIYIFQTVIRNLFSNAIKFTQNGGRILINASTSDNKEVTISVKDTGIGMDDEIMGNLFQEDVKTNRPGLDGQSSTGLGLIICKGLVESQGGEISVESHLDYGTTFKFTLPAQSTFDC